MRKLVPWIGGKRALVKKILPLIPVHRVYIEPFFGGGSIFFAKEPCEVEIINDLDARLVNLFRVVQRHPDEFLEELRYLTYSRQILKEFHNQPGLTDIERAARFFFIVKASFGARLTGPPSLGISSARTRRPGKISRRRVTALIDAVHERLAGVYIESQDFEKLLRARDTKDAFLYVDPPYVGTEGMYACRFTNEDHDRLHGVLAAVKSKWLLSYGDHPQVRRRYRGFRMTTVQVSYVLGASTSGRAKAKRARELLIRNY